MEFNSHKEGVRGGGGLFEIEANAPPACGRDSFLLPLFGSRD